ncbi:MAG: HAMP domain-containing histidine kinase [Campylobacterales bacterium]|nr:HAMP domain-containing histidine kinase [Campylobacterales bacterium]
MFRNLRLNIFIYYLLTVTTFLVLEYYAFFVLRVENVYLLTVVLLCFVTLSGVFISKLAIDPLLEYVKNLQALSKETLHELNLPISTITTNSQMLKKSLEDEKSLKRLERIESACGMLKERYNELEYLIKMQSRQEIKEQFCVDELVKERIFFLEKIYPQIEFRVEVEPLEIFSDKKGLSKVIDNLIDNAVKYSMKSKKIFVKVEAKSLIIEDYGIGMDEVEIVRIFDQFYQANKEMRGFGIGLSMVKRFCDTNNISLKLNSKVNVGTKIELQFKE